MKTNKLTKWAALLLTVSGMAAVPPTIMAAAGDNKVVITVGTTAESDKSYLSNANSAAPLDVSGSGVIYSGTNITLTGTGLVSSGAYGAWFTIKERYFYTPAQSPPRPTALGQPIPFMFMALRLSPVA
ncbi:MAG: hypothetical protein LBD30_08050, partial [Verrucomicrobiales bacterium]|nr:hypothetical protein [Verrucomicrobiales bacterium]